MPSFELTLLSWDSATARVRRQTRHLHAVCLRGVTAPLWALACKLYEEAVRTATKD